MLPLLIFKKTKILIVYVRLNNSSYPLDELSEIKEDH